MGFSVSVFSWYCRSYIFFNNFQTATYAKAVELIFACFQAKAYIKRHEGQLQERLAQSKSTRDIYARFNILLNSVSFNFM